MGDALLTKPALSKKEHAALKRSIKDELLLKQQTTRLKAVYRAQCKRADDCTPPQAVEYTMDDFIRFSLHEMRQPCLYCKANIPVKKFCFDHMIPVARGGKFTLENLCICCKSCNEQKGKLTHDEFVNLIKYLEFSDYELVAIVDIKRRLSAGGRSYR